MPFLVIHSTGRRPPSSSSSTDDKVARRAMPYTFFRLIHKARTRSQRKRLYYWLIFICVGFCLLVYMQYTSFIDGQTLLPEISGRSAGLAPVDRQPQGRPRKGSDLKLLETNDNAASNKLANALGEEESFVQDDLLPDLAPPIVHFVWCNTGTFEYKHYLSIKRADFVIKPDKIFFHYHKLPSIDSEQYYTWFQQTLSEHVHMVLRPLNISSCPDRGPEKYMMVLSLLEALGGIFVPEDAILVDFPVHLRAAQFVSGVVAKSMSEYLDGIIVAKKNGFISPSSRSGLNVVIASGRSKIQGTIDPCGSINHYNTEEDGDCICVKVSREIFPSHIWEPTGRFATLARVAGYQTTEIQQRFSKRTTIPKIAHYINWESDLKFSTYLSVMSSLHVAGLTQVYIHGLKQPEGIWWRRLQETRRVVYVYREYPEHWHDKARMTQELAQGIMRVNILLKYGGVYCDNKVIWTNSIPDDHFGYDALAAPDWHKYGNWPDSISHTTVMAKKNSEYLLKLRTLQSDNHQKKFWFVDQFLAYKILEKHPDVLFLDRHFQVKCQNGHCHPTWQPGYKVPMSENPPGGPFSWQNDTLSLYWDVFPVLELDTIKYTSGIVVDAARRVLQKSGISIQELTNR